MLAAAIEAGADDVQSAAEGHEVFCAPERLAEAAAALETRFGAPESAKLVWRPKNLVPVSGPAAGTLLKLMDALEDCDDVQSVYANFDINAEEMERLAS
jgi:transcriptional/translational regulatory protein YebC/TACO1